MNFKKNWKRFFTVSRASEGFTLVELIVVIAILAILAGIAVPAYSGYIKKANKAADLQLLGAVNTAFAAAALENGKDVQTIRNGGVNPRWAAAGEGRALVGVTLYNEEFQKYFAGNTGAFKVINELIFVNGAFVDPTTATEGVSSFTYTIGDEEVTLYLSDEDIESLRNSPWAQTGLSDVDYAVGIMTNLDTTDTRLLDLIQSDANKAIVEQYTGIDVDSDAFMDMVIAKAETMPGGATEDNCLAVENQFLANAAVLAATSNSNFDANAFASQLGSDYDTAKNDILSNLQNDPQMAMSQAAFSYAMYTSYMGDDAPENFTLTDVLDTMKTEGFQNYLKNDAADDIAGYNAAMNMINSSAQNGNAVTNVMVNGFNNTEMQTLLNQILNPSES